MRKGTKGIRKVFTGTNEYFVYDLDEDAFGKRKRLYGKTEGELKEKIEQAENERSARIAIFKPKTKALAEHIQYYFKNAVGNIPSRDIKRLMLLFERAVLETEIDKDIDTITEKDLDSVVEIDDVFKKIFELSNEDGITKFDFKKIKLPKEETTATTNYILTPEEFEDMLSFCIADNCTRYGKNELLITFSMLTGLMFSTIKKLTTKDFDLENKTVLINKKPFPLSEKCVDWLKQSVEQEFIPPLESNDEIIVFTNSNNVSPTLQSIQSTLSSITKRCGLPKGITGKTLCKSYIISELSKGATVKSLCKLFGYKNRRKITEIQDEYEIRQALF